MIAFDTNLLFPALESSHGDHEHARAFIEALTGDRVAVCELVLMEVFVLVLHPATCSRPLSPPAAVGLIETLRTNPDWRLIDYPGGLMGKVWDFASQPGFTRRRIFDIRLAVTLVQQGVTRFATRNVKDFEALGFREVFDPLAAA